MQTRGACRRCGAPLIFVPDHKGRRVPVDGRRARCAFPMCGHSRVRHSPLSETNETLGRGICCAPGCPCYLFIHGRNYQPDLHPRHRCEGARR